MIAMITIDLGTREYYDDLENKFVYEDGGSVRFEYSLKALYEWEAKWLKSFLKGDLTNEELIDFYMTMALDPIEKRFINEDVKDQLYEYIKESHSATTFSSHEGQNGNKTLNGKILTSEELYALMIMAGVPIEFENRNLNRLLIVLRVISAYNAPPKKMDKSDIYKQNAQLNAARKKQYQTKG